MDVSTVTTMTGHGHAASLLTGPGALSLDSADRDTFPIPSESPTVR